MVRVSTRLAVFVMTCLVAVSMAMAQDQPDTGKKKGRQTPEERKAAAEKRFDDMEKAAKHDPATGVLTKDEFVAAVKAAGGKMADRAEQIFDRITKADKDKITKAEYVTFATQPRGNRKKGGDSGGDKGT